MILFTLHSDYSKSYILKNERTTLYDEQFIASKLSFIFSQKLKF